LGFPQNFHPDAFPREWLQNGYEAIKVVALQRLHFPGGNRKGVRLSAHQEASAYMGISEEQKRLILKNE
jgi:hypothetical protein